MKTTKKLTREQKKAIQLILLKKYNEKVGIHKAWEIIERDKLYKYVNLNDKDEPLCQ